MKAMTESNRDGGRNQRGSTPLVRWDRSLGRKIAQSRTARENPDSAIVSQSTASSHLGATSLPYRLARRLLKRPLSYFRDFVNAPVLSNKNETNDLMFGIYNELKVVGDKLGTLDSKVDLLQSIDGRLDFLHAKADEQTRKNWPIIELEDLFAVPLADGYIFVPRQDDDLLLMFARATSQGLEPGTRRVIKNILRPGDHAIDVGAGVAMHTVSMAQSVGPDGTVDAFEPEPRLQSCLRKAFLLNGLNQVTLHPAAVGCTDGEAPFFVSTTIGHSSLYELETEPETGEPLTVPIRTLDSVIGSNADVNLMKVDVEGAETDVIGGAKRVISQSTDCAIVAECGPSHLNRVDISLEDWIGQFMQLNYEAYAIVEPTGDIQPADMDWLACQESTNVLFLKKDGANLSKILDRNAGAQS